MLSNRAFSFDICSVFGSSPAKYASSCDGFIVRHSSKKLCARAAEAKVRYACPAADIMPAGVPFACEIADFILKKAVLRERLPRKLVHIAFNVLIRQSQLSAAISRQIGVPSSTIKL